MERLYDLLPTPFGDLAVAVDPEGRVVATAFGGLPELKQRFDARNVTLERSPSALEPVRRQLDEYCAGTRKEFDLPLAGEGTDHQRRVWKALEAIPYGETRSYGELAKTLGSSPRAVGRANGSNPISLFVPCHRVIGADGSLTGYAFGTDRKRHLLDFERSNR